MPQPSVLTRPWGSELLEGGAPFLGLLDLHLGLRLTGAFDAARCEAWLRRVYAARHEWTEDFGGEQFCLGRAWYTHYETGRSAEYFAGAQASDALVEAHLPGFQAELVAAARRLLGAPVRPRSGWCGAGVHVFPAGEQVARRGGVVHFDTEGLGARQIASRRRALTLLLMLGAPEQGGELALWDRLYSGEDHVEPEARGARVLAAYGPGDLLVIDSLRLHQIQPFGGSRDRVSATLHVAEVDAGSWEAWF